MELAALLAEYETKLNTGLSNLTQNELLTLGLDMERVAARVDAKKAAVYAHMKRCETHRAVRERSPGLALANRLNISAARGSRHINRADTLVNLLPLVHAAYLDGRLNTEQVDRIIRVAQNSDLLEQLARDQHQFVSWAGKPYKKFDADMHAWTEKNDPTDPQTAAEKAHTKRKLIAARGLDGVTLVQIDMPNECYAQLRELMAPIEEELFNQDWQDAKAIHGVMTIPDDLVRNTNQRTFDAFMQLIRQGGTAEQTDPGIATIVTILMDKATFDHEAALAAGESVASPTISDIENYRCETINGFPVSARFAFDAAIVGEIRRAVLDLENHDIAMSKKGRLFTGLKRQALIIRDRWCQTPGCATPASRCEADHLLDHGSGGETTINNGGMKCKPCHRHKTRLQTQGLYHLAA